MTRRLVILAAGRGTRLGAAAEDRPKCMTEVADRPLLEWQIAAARATGFDEIIVLRGYRADRIAYDGVIYRENPVYERTNMVFTLWNARDLCGDDFVLSYGDIVYTPVVLQTIADADRAINVTVDMKWKDYWTARFADPLADAETLRLSGEGTLLEIGQKPKSIEEIEGQYIGLLSFRGEGAQWLWKLLDEDIRAHCAGRRSIAESRSFPDIYMTDVLQALIRRGRPLHAVPIQGGWLEVDNPDDLAYAREHTRPGPLNTLDILR